MRFRYVFAILSAALLAVSACSSDDAEQSSDEPDATATTDSGTDSDPDSGTDSGSGSESLPDVDPDDLDAGEGAFDAFVPEQCEFLFDLSVSIGLAATGQVDASEFDVDEAPGEVRDDVQTMVDAFAEYDPTNPTTGQVFASDDFEEASSNIEAFIEANCDPEAVG